jgi:acyl-CoA thioesterase FadM
VRFRKELKNREMIRIESQTVELVSSKILVLEQKMIRVSDGKIASDAMFTVGIFDMQARKLIDAPAGWLRAVGVK